jgi:hypothetical protein
MSGWKQWQVAEVVDADDFQNYLQDQVVQVYATEAARGSALGTALTEGMVSYINSTNQIAVYDGANWGGISQAVSPNYIINGAFDIWQRGTSFANTQFTVYTADRWYGWRGAGARFSVSRQTPTLQGFRFAARIGRPSGNTELNAINFLNSFETSNSVALANQPATFSFWARAGANFSAASSALGATVSVGTGTDENWISGYTGNNNAITQNVTLTTSWQRFTLTGTLPANTNEITTRFNYTPVGTAGADDWFEVTGVQLEAGSVATPFKRNANSLQGELAACQRYYWRAIVDGSGDRFAQGHNTSTTEGLFFTQFPVQMRTSPLALEQSGTAGDYSIAASTGLVTASAVPTYVVATPWNAVTSIVVASGLTAGQGSQARATSANSFLGWSAEL